MYKATFFTVLDDSSGVARSRENTTHGREGEGEVMRRVRTQHPRSREHPKMKIEKNVIERHSVQPLPPTVQLAHSFKQM